MYISGNPRVDGHARDLHQLRHRSDAISTEPTSSTPRAPARFYTNIKPPRNHDINQDLHCTELNYNDQSNYAKLYDFTKIYVEFYIAKSTSTWSPSTSSSTLPSPPTTQKPRRCRRSAAAAAL
jgi:hypothetical protein